MRRMKILPKSWSHLKGSPQTRSDSDSEGGLVGRNSGACPLNAAYLEMTEVIVGTIRS